MGFVVLFMSVLIINKFLSITKDRNKIIFYMKPQAKWFAGLKRCWETKSPRLKKKPRPCLWQTAPPPPIPSQNCPSWHKICAMSWKNYGREISYHIKSRLSATNVQNGGLGAEKFNFLHNWSNLQGRLELSWLSFFA